MNQNESFDFFLRFLKERHDELKKNTNELSNSLVSENKDEKLDACSNALISAESLARTLSKKDHPLWLRELIGSFKWYVDNHKRNTTSNQKLNDSLFKNKSSLMSHNWDFTTKTNEVDFSFDEIYQRFKKDSKLSELFDGLISTLEKMISSNEIDSIKTRTSLEQLLAMLKQNKDGSYFSTMASWEFIRGFTKNLAWEALDEIPVVKNLKSAFEKTISEMDVELENMHKDIAAEMKNKYNTAIQTLTYSRSETKQLESAIE